MAVSGVKSEYVNQMKAEKDNLDPSVFVHASRLLAEEIDRVERGIKYTEVHNDKKTKLATKVLIPVKEYPKVNFVGKLMGPQGMSIKRLQADTGCKMSIMGKGSMKDRKKEEELRKSGDTKYQHLSEDLHVMVEVFAEAPDAYARVSNALTELSKYMVPDFQDQMQQPMDYLNGEDMRGPEMEVDPRAAMQMGPRGRGGRGRGVMRGHPPGHGPPQGHHASAAAAAAARGGLLATPRGRAAPRGAPPQRGMPGAMRARGAPSPAMRGARAPPARAAPPAYSEEYSYQQPYEEPGYEYEQPYESNTYGAAEEAQYFDYGEPARPAREQSYEPQGYGNGYSQPPAREERWGGGGAPAYKASPSRGKAEYRAHPYGGGRGRF